MLFYDQPFYCAASDRMMKLTELNGEAWLVYKHSDGQWVTLRKATDEDIAKIDRATSCRIAAAEGEG